MRWIKKIRVLFLSVRGKGVSDEICGLADRNYLTDIAEHGAGSADWRPDRRCFNRSSVRRSGAENYPVYLWQGQGRWTPKLTEQSGQPARSLQIDFKIQRKYNRKLLLSIVYLY